MRVVASHAGPIRELEKKFDKTQIDLHFPKLICKSEAETLAASYSIHSNSENTEPPGETGSGEEELARSVVGGSFPRQTSAEIQAAIADAPFMQNAKQPESSPPLEPSIESKFDAPDSRTTLERLRILGVPPTNEVRKLIAQTPEPRMEHNVSALEEESATKGLKSPIAAFKYFLTHNCQPRLSGPQSWWNRAATALGKERRDRLIQAVFEYAGEEVVLFTSGRQLSLAQAQLMSWSAIADAGGEP